MAYIWVNGEHGRELQLIVRLRIDKHGKQFKVVNFFDAHIGETWLLVGTHKQCENFIKQVAGCIEGGEAVIEPEDIDPDLELLDML